MSRCHVLTTGCRETRHTFCQLGSRLDTSHTQEARINERRMPAGTCTNRITFFMRLRAALALRSRVIRYFKNVGRDYLMNGQPTNSPPTTSLCRAVTIITN